MERRGMPGPYFAPSFGEKGRREALHGDLGFAIGYREAHGIAPYHGSRRCPIVVAAL
jgi:hypothetical protein